MLPPYIDNTERYRFVIDRRNTLCVVFATQAMLAANGPVTPLWHREAGDERSLNALIRWIAVRRDRWQEWGRLAETIGAEAFYSHMRERMQEEPIAEPTGPLLQRRDDPVEILLGEMMHGPQGMFLEPLYLHRFASPEAREAFYDWFFQGTNHENLAALVDVAFSDGTALLGEMLDRLAEVGAAPVPRAERRRRAKAAIKAA